MPPPTGVPKDRAPSLTENTKAAATVVRMSWADLTEEEDFGELWLTGKEPPPNDNIEAAASPGRAEGKVEAVKELECDALTQASEAPPAGLVRLPSGSKWLKPFLHAMRKSDDEEEAPEKATPTAGDDDEEAKAKVVAWVKHCFNKEMASGCQQPNEAVVRALRQLKGAMAGSAVVAAPAAAKGGAQPLERCAATVRTLRRIEAAMAGSAAVAVPTVAKGAPPLARCAATLGPAAEAAALQTWPEKATVKPVALPNAMSTESASLDVEGNLPPNPEQPLLPPKREDETAAKAATMSVECRGYPYIKTGQQEKSERKLAAQIADRERRGKAIANPVITKNRFLILGAGDEESAEQTNQSADSDNTSPISKEDKLDQSVKATKRSKKKRKGGSDNPCKKRTKDTNGETCENLYNRTADNAVDEAVAHCVNKKGTAEPATWSQVAAVVALIGIALLLGHKCDALISLLVPMLISVICLFPCTMRVKVRMRMMVILLVTAMAILPVAGSNKVMPITTATTTKTMTNATEDS